jgi:spermidine/putrescine transport system substrate-binding protein
MTDREQGAERPSWPVGGYAAGLTRRAMLQRTAGSAAALSGAGWLLAACGSSSTKTSSIASSSSPNIPIASKAHPLTLPVYSDNPAIPSGRSPEKGPLIIYDWAEYLSSAVVKSFEERYGVTAQVTNFAAIDEALDKVSSGAVRPDVWVPDANHVAQLVDAKLIQPINHSYIPNLSNVIPAAADPWYDQGARYSSPNFINLFGIAWRNDLLKIDPGSLSSPWDVFWDAPKGTPIGLVNAGPFDAIQMAMLRAGNDGLDSVSQKDITDAAAQLAELKGAKWQYTSFQPLGAGIEKLAYAFNGDMMVVPENLAKGTPLSSVSFYFPPDGKGPILNDLWVIPKTAQHPVLAHLWMNHFLETQSAIDNFRDVGYQTMLKDLTADTLKAAKVGPDHAIDMAFATAADQENGYPTPIFNTQQLTWIESSFAQLTA